MSLPVPATGFQLVAGPFVVPTQSELQDCYYFRVPAETWVHRFEIAQNAGTHHMNLFRVSEPSIQDDGQVQHGCWDSLPFQEWGLLANSQITSQDGGASTDWVLPDGIAAHLQAGELVMIQTHYVNATTQATGNGRGKVVINFHGIDPASVTAEMGTMFANNRNIFLRAGERSSFGSLCSVPQDIHVIAASGHFHSRGTRFTIATQDAAGARSAPIYTSTEWDNPPFATYDASPVLAPAGGGLYYSCDFFNPLDYDIVFGPHVEFEEHCNVFAFYYPRVTALGALYCF